LDELNTIAHEESAAVGRDFLDVSVPEDRVLYQLVTRHGPPWALFVHEWPSGVARSEFVDPEE
jgi:hypothetical protein